MRALLPLVLALALVAGGCGDSDDENATTPSANPQEAPQESPEAEASATDDAGGGDVVEIRMKDIQFDPQQATVRVGQTVRWTNEDDVQHDADAADGQFESELYGEGGTQEYTPEEPGTIEYVCSVHPNMQGTLTVEE